MTIANLDTAAAVGAPIARLGAPHLLAAHWGQIVRSHYVESPPPGGRASSDRVLELIRRFARAPAQAMPGIGLGIEHRIAEGRMTGQMPVLNGALVHAAFSREAREGGAHRG